MNWKKQDTVCLSDILERDYWIEHRSATFNWFVAVIES